MSWHHIQQLMDEIDGPAVIVEDGKPRYIVVSIEEWRRRGRPESTDLPGEEPVLEPVDEAPPMPEEPWMDDGTMFSEEPPF